MLRHIVVFAFTILSLSHADTSLGKCPPVDPLPEFHMNKILGYWYAIQSTQTNSPCVTYNITRDEQHIDHYKITEIKQHHTIWSSVLYHEHKTTGVLTVPDPTVPAKMALDLPLDIGTSAFIVFMTDYDHVLAIFTCKKLPLIYSWNAHILSRTPNLDMEFVDKVRTRISSYNIDPFNLHIISQSKCAPPGHKGVIFQTASNLGIAASNAVSNAGSKITDFAVEGSSKLKNVSKSVVEEGNNKLQEIAKPISTNLDPDYDS